MKASNGLQDGSFQLKECKIESSSIPGVNLKCVTYAQPIWVPLMKSQFNILDIEMGYKYAQEDTLTDT